MRFNSEIHIEGSAEAAWEVLGLGYGEICQWTNSLNSESLIRMWRRIRSFSLLGYNYLGYNYHLTLSVLPHYS